jgi:hypothetical protein
VIRGGILSPLCSGKCANCFIYINQELPLIVPRRSYPVGPFNSCLQLPYVLVPFGHILMMVDQFTKWVECIPLPSQSAEETTRAAVNQFFSRFRAVRCSPDSRTSVPQATQSPYPTSSYWVCTLCWIKELKLGDLVYQLDTATVKGKTRKLSPSWKRADKISHGLCLFLCYPYTTTMIPFFALIAPNHELPSVCLL